MSKTVIQQPRNQLILDFLLCCSWLEASIITNPFCSTKWLTHSTIPEGARSFSYTTVCLMTSPHHFPAELFWGDAVGSFPLNHTPFPLKQNNIISHKLWELIALNHMRSVWLYHAAEANISVLKFQSGNAIIKREREMMMRTDCPYHFHSLSQAVQSNDFLSPQIWFELCITSTEFVKATYPTNTQIKIKYLSRVPQQWRVNKFLGT